MCPFLIALFHLEIFFISLTFHDDIASLKWRCSNDEFNFHVTALRALNSAINYISEKPYLIKYIFRQMQPDICKQDDFYNKNKMILRLLMNA